MLEHGRLALVPQRQLAAGHAPGLAVHLFVFVGVVVVVVGLVMVGRLRRNGWGGLNDQPTK